MDPNRFKKSRFALLSPSSLYSSTYHFPFITNMVINHEITIFDFSRFLFATLTFGVVKSPCGSNGPVYQINRRGFFACYWVQRSQSGVTPLVDLIDPYITSLERGFFKCYGVQRTHVWRLRGN